MLRWLGRLYARRIINVNVNIVLAGVLALGPTLAVVHLATQHSATARLAAWLGIDEEWVVNAVTLAADACFDVAIYYCLHWLANHWPRALRLRRKKNEHPRLTFFKDATLVQVERMALSPLLYLVALTIQHVLMRNQADPVHATWIGFAVAMIITRCAHTLLMLRSRRCSRSAALAERRAARLERAAHRAARGRGVRLGPATPPGPLT